MPVRCSTLTVTFLFYVICQQHPTRILPSARRCPSPAGARADLTQQACAGRVKSSYVDALVRAASIGARYWLDGGPAIEAIGSSLSCLWWPAARRRVGFCDV